jgi:hypothetical protein
MWIMIVLYLNMMKFGANVAQIGPFQTQAMCEQAMVDVNQTIQSPQKGLRTQGITAVCVEAGQ